MSVIKMRATQRKGVERVRAVAAKRPKPTSSIAHCDAAMKRPMTIVHVRANPFQPSKALNTDLPAMESALKSMLGSYMKAYKDQPGKLAPHSITVHEDHCAFGVVLWPRANEGVDLVEMQEAVEERDSSCGCHPLVMYPGALA